MWVFPVCGPFGWGDKGGGGGGGEEGREKILTNFFDIEVTELPSSADGSLSSFDGHKLSGRAHTLKGHHTRLTDMHSELGCNGGGT